MRVRPCTASREWVGPASVRRWHPDFTHSWRGLGAEQVTHRFLQTTWPQSTGGCLPLTPALSRTSHKLGVGFSEEVTTMLPT